MKNRRILKPVVTVLTAVLLVSALYVFTTAAAEDQEELTPSDMEILMKQVAESEATRNYADLVPDVVFANAEVFGIDSEGEHAAMYCRLNAFEYVVFKEKAYLMSGSAGEAIISFDYTEDGPKLTAVEWSADGSDHDKWMKENFPAEYLEKSNNYDAYDEDGNNLLMKEMEKTVEEVMGAPVEKEDLLFSDAEEGTYEIIRTIESGDTPEDYTFETETIDSGRIK